VSFLQRDHGGGHWIASLLAGHHLISLELPPDSLARIPRMERVSKRSPQPVSTTRGHLKPTATRDGRLP
jgi:hypothetical protein